MAIAFPVGPSTDDYYLYHGRLYKYDGAIWKLRRVFADPAAIKEGGLGSTSVANFKSDNNHGLVFLESGTIGGAVSEVDIDITPYTAYDPLELWWIGVTQVDDNVHFLMRCSTDGGGTFNSSASDYNWAFMHSSSALASQVDPVGIAAQSAPVSIELLAGQSNLAQGNTNSRVMIFGAPDAAKITRFEIMSTTILATSTTHIRAPQWGCANNGAVNDTTDLRFYAGTGNLDGGTYVLLGHRS